MFRYESVNSTRKLSIVAEIVSLLKKIYKRDAPFRAVFKVETLALLQNGYPRGVLCYNINHVLNRQKNTTVPKKDIFLVLQFLGSQSEVFARRVKSCVSKFYGFVNLKVIFNNTCRVKSFFPYKDRFSRSQRSKVVYKAGCWDCDSFYVGKTKRRLHDRKTEHFKAITQDCHASALADHVISTGHNIKWMQKMFIKSAQFS